MVYQDIEMENVVIRKAQENDLEELYKVCSKTFIDTYKGKGRDRPDEMVYEYVREKFEPSILNEEIKNQKIDTYVAVSDNKIVGYLKLTQEEPPGFVTERNLCHLERIYLLKENQGKGIGKSLLEKSYEVAKKRGYLGVWLGVWDENQEAISFYLKSGFKKVGSHNWEFDYEGFHYVDTDDVMVKLID